jgi:hypothetical protein
MKKIKIAVLFIGLCMQCYSQAGLIGNWRRENPGIKDWLDTKQLRPGDLQIFPDSTFHIQGDTATQNSTIPGWHVGDDYKGTWEQRGNDYLTLWIGPKKEMMSLAFKIKKLTKEKLILKILPGNNINADIIYTRF